MNPNPVQVKKNVMAELAKIKSKKGIYTFVLKPEEYSIVNKVICSYCTNHFKFSGLYISLNNSCKSMLEMFSKEKIDSNKLFFIECVGQEQKKSQISRCISLTGNKSLTELSLSISEACRNERIEFIFFDSLSMLLVYHGLEITERFLHHILNKFKALSLFVVLISLEDERSNKLIPFLSQLSDNVIKL